MWDFVYFVLAILPLALGIGYFEYRKARLLHVERMLAIEKGLWPASLNERSPGVGLGLTAFLRVVSGEYDTGWGGAAVLMSCIGLAYLLYYAVETRGRHVS